MKFFEESGRLTIGSRLRWLTEIITQDAASIYQLYEVDIKPKWFPVIYMLSNGRKMSVTELAKAIGQTHPSVSNIVKELAAADLAAMEKARDDQRSTIVCLTAKGDELYSRMKRVCADVESVVEEIESQSPHKLWTAIDNWERALAEKSLLKRVMEMKNKKFVSVVEIVDYTPEYLMTFKRLNIMWINSHWSLEPHDLEVLNDPEASIISKGGHIFVAMVDGAPMGVVAMCRMDSDEYDYELAKLAVDPEARGLGIGEKVCMSALDWARRRGAKKIFLESNTLLKPAISLYRKLGFSELKEYRPAYERGDIQMELTLE